MAPFADVTGFSWSRRKITRICAKQRAFAVTCTGICRSRCVGLTVRWCAVTCSSRGKEGRSKTTAEISALIQSCPMFHHFPASSNAERSKQSHIWIHLTVSSPAMKFHQTPQQSGWDDVRCAGGLQAYSCSGQLSQTRTLSCNAENGADGSNAPRHGHHPRNWKDFIGYMDNHTIYHSDCTYTKIICSLCIYTIFKKIKDRKTPQVNFFQ